MFVRSLLEVFYFLTVYLTVGTTGLTLPLNQALDSTVPLTTVSLNVSNPTVVETCTSSLLWTGSTAYDSQFTNNCFQAWRTYMATDGLRYKSNEFEFLRQGEQSSHPLFPTMATPRRYINKSCTIAIANLADIPRGILPAEPPGPFPRSDLARFSSFRPCINAVRGGCVGKKKEAGWVAAGRQQAMAILIFSTNAPVDRIIPRGVIPSNFLNATTGAVGGLDTAAL